MKQTTRSLVNLAVLLAVAGGVGLFAYYGVHRKQEQEQADKEKKEKLFASLDKAKLKGLTVTAKGQTTVLAAKKPDGWEIVSPVQTAADKATVDALVARLADLKSKRVVEEKAKDLAPYGLATPKFSVVAQVEGEKDLVLRAGDENEFDSSVYVATGDSSDVLQAEGGFKYALEKDTFDLRDKRLMPFEDAQVKELAVRVGEARYALAKKAGTWEIVAPAAAGSAELPLGKADETTVNRILGTLRSLTASKFVTDLANPAEEATYGLLKPTVEASVTLEPGGRMTLVAGKVAEKDGPEKHYARLREGASIAEIPDTIFRELAVKPVDLKDKTVLAFDREKVKTLKLALGGETLAVERTAKPDGGSGDDWKITSPTPGTAKKSKVSGLLWTLSSLKASGFADENPTDLAKYGLAQPVRTLTALDESGKELGTLAIGSENGETLYVKNASDKRVFEIEKSKLGELPASRADLEEPAAAADAGTNG